MTHSELISSAECHRGLDYRGSQGSDQALTFWACSACQIMIVIDWGRVAKTYPLVPRRPPFPRPPLDGRD